MNDNGSPAGGGRGRPGSDGPEPSLKPTKITTLLVAFVAAGVVAWVLMRSYFGQIPDLNWLPGLTLAALAVVEGVLSHNTRARIEGRPRQGRINPLLVARYAVLAKASSLGGAIVAGLYGGVALWAIDNRGVLRVADLNLGPAIAGVVGAGALVIAALVLERSCRVPPGPEDDDKAGTGPQTTRR